MKKERERDNIKLRSQSLANSSPYKIVQNIPVKTSKNNKVVEQQRLTNYLTQIKHNLPTPPIVNKSVAKEGLLGTFAQYEIMSKYELIEKLLMTEQLLKRFYKENKELKEQLANKR